MSTLDQFREGLGRAFDSLAEGWSHLRERAGQAMTRFVPGRAGEVQTAEDQMALRGARWGLLPAEVSESDKGVTVRLEVPGMERDDFEVTVVEGRFLVVRGEKRVQREDRRGHFHIMERAYGRFERAVPLPTEVDEQGTRARYSRGVLSVEMPKSPRSQGRRVEVQSG